MFIVNGYLMQYSPHSKNAGITGIVYVHRAVMSAVLGRPLGTNEFVHHIDGNRMNNAVENLELMTRAEHGRLHAMSRGGKVKLPHPCEVCGEKTVNEKYCCKECSSFSQRVVKRPDAVTLQQEIIETSWVGLGRKYGVTDNAVRKWARGYDIM